MKLQYLNILGLMMVVSLFCASCEQDNYSLPNGGIKGSVLNTNNVTVQTEQPGGIKIRLIEEKYGKDAIPNDFWCKADGTFENDFVFEGKYKIVPVEGAFFPADTAEVDVEGLIQVNFKVVPFLTIDASIKVDNGNVTVTYKISRDRVGGKIMQAKTLISAYPTVSNTINEMSITHDLSAIKDIDILNGQYTDTITDLASGNTYYIRIGAIAENSYNKYNYSKILKVSIP